MQLNVKTPAVKSFALLVGQTFVLAGVLLFLMANAHFLGIANAATPVCGDGSCDFGEDIYCSNSCLVSGVSDCETCSSGGGGGGGGSGTGTGTSCVFGVCYSVDGGTDSCTPLNLCVPTGPRCTTAQTCEWGGSGDACTIEGSGLDDECTLGCTSDGQCIKTSASPGGSLTNGCFTELDCDIPSGGLGGCIAPGFCASSGFPGSATSCNDPTDCYTGTGTYCTMSGDCIPGGTTNNCSSSSDCYAPPLPTGYSCATGTCQYDPAGTNTPCTIGAYCSGGGGGGGGGGGPLPPQCNIYQKCVPGGGGAPCIIGVDSTCWAPPTCNSNKQCVSGGGGVPCASDAGCQQPLGCNYLEQCVPGGTRGNCVFNPNCVPVKIPHCSGLVCTDALTTGTPCTTYAECLPPPGCNSAQQCVYGGTQGICGSNYDCLPPLGCNSSKQCVPGGTNGNCYNNIDCLEPLGCDATTLKCISGGKDGNCYTNNDCKPKPRCNEITQKCVELGGTGSICSKESDCQTARCTNEYSSDPYKCVPYNPNNSTQFGRACSLDSSDPDKICQPPPKKGKLLIYKSAKGGSSSDLFQFYGNPLPIGFALRDGGSAFLDVEPGTKENPIRYNIAELVPEHWNFVGAFCDKSFILTTNSVEEVSVESEETTTCTFYNEKNGILKIINQNDSFAKAGNETAEYAIFPTPIYETITTTGNQGIGVDHELKPGTYAIYQKTPLDWQLTSVECNGVPTGIVDGTITTSLDPGQTKTCVFKNKIKEGNLIINKHTIGGNDKFYFDINRIGQGGGTRQSESITTVNGLKDLPLTLAPGTYNISEIVTDGWVLTDFTCSNTTYDKAQNGVINVIIVDTKTTICDFYNTKKGGLKIFKETIGGNETFNYKIENYSQGQNVGLPKTQTATITTTANKGDSGLLALDQGSYNITEELPADWKFDSATCDSSYTYGPNGVLNVSVSNGQTTNCTFKNSKKGKANLIIIKEADGPDATFNYAINFVSSGSGTSPLIPTAVIKTENGSGDSGILAEAQDTYNITEKLPTDWKLNSVACVNESGVSIGTPDLATSSIKSVTLTDNKTVTCTFKNAKNKLQGNLKIIKETEGQKSASEDFHFNIDLTGSGETINTAMTKEVNVTTFSTGGGTGVKKGRGETALLPEVQGIYSIIEDELPKGWSFDSATCDRPFQSAPNGVTNVTILGGKTTTCTFKNSKNGFLVIKKKTGQDGDAEFKFNVDPTPTAITIKTKNAEGTNDGKCPDGTQPTTGGTCPNGDRPNGSILEIKSGSYNITEVPATAWSLSSVVCKEESGNPTGILNSGLNTMQKVNIIADQTTTCTFTNSKNRGGSGGGGGGIRTNEEEIPLQETTEKPY